jgi:hypothetical protein
MPQAVTTSVVGEVSPNKENAKMIDASFISLSSSPPHTEEPSLSTELSKKSKELETARNIINMMKSHREADQSSIKILTEKRKSFKA